VIEAYVAGLEASTGDLSKVVSVGSFFISRTDTEVDKRLEIIGSEAALALRGQAAISQALMAYQIFQTAFSGPRWEALASRGANPQRPLWASTSTKNPAYDELLYVNALALPNTVNTLPDATIQTILSKGTHANTDDLMDRFTHAQAIVEQLADMGIDMTDVAKSLESEGVQKFQASFTDVLAAIDRKATTLA
jgi:transaldolase